MDVTATATAVAATTSQGSVIWAYIIIVAMIALIPHLVDIIYAYKSQNNIRKLLIEKASADKKLDHEELKLLIKDSGKAPPGITGLSRGTMAISAIAILGIALFHLLTTRTETDSQVIGNVLSMLGGLIAAIIGFYFGGKAVKEAGESREAAKEKSGEQEQQPAPAPAPQPPAPPNPT
jgi:hypothetical protein